MTRVGIGFCATTAFVVSFAVAAWHGAGAPSLYEVASLVGISGPAANATPEAGTPERAAEPLVDPFALAEAIVTARRAFSDSDDDIVLAAARERFVGRELVWEVRYVAPLCTAPDRCVVLPFDHARLDERFLQGWMPRLALSADEHRVLVDRCAPHHRCVVTVRGELSKLELSPNLPTSIELSALRILDARSETEGESWMRRRPQG